MIFDFKYFILRVSYIVFAQLLMGNNQIILAQLTHSPQVQLEKSAFPPAPPKVKRLPSESLPGEKSFTHLTPPRVPIPPSKEDILRLKLFKYPVDVKSILSDADKIVSCVPMGGGNYEAMKLTFQREDGSQIHGILKVDDVGTVKEFKENTYTYLGFRFETPLIWHTQEVAASLFADIFGMTEVPYTTSLSIDVLKLEKENPEVFFGECSNVFLRHKNILLYQLKKNIPFPQHLMGSVQYFVEETEQLFVAQKRFRKDYQGPTKMRLFDFLTFNCDRSGNNNILVKKEEIQKAKDQDRGSFYQSFHASDLSHIMIDNGFAFTSYDDLNGIRSNQNDNEKYCDHLFDLIKGPKEKLCGLVNYVGYNNEIQKLIGLGESYLKEKLAHLIPEKSFQEFWERILFVNYSCFSDVKNLFSSSQNATENECSFKDLSARSEFEMHSQVSKIENHLNTFSPKEKFPTIMRAKSNLPIFYVPKTPKVMRNYFGEEYFRSH
jgi:hypothetical protein